TESLATEQFTFTGEGTDADAYLKLGMSIQHHLAVRFRNKKAISYRDLKRRMPPSPYGMSGGGVFAWSKQLPNPAALTAPKLVGILNKYRRQKNMFLAPRLNCYIGGTAAKHPDFPIVKTVPMPHRGPLVR